MRFSLHVVQLIALLSTALLPSEYAYSSLCVPTIVANKPGLNGTKANMAVDRDTNTYFESSHNNWQYLQIDLGCLQRMTGLRRHMTRRNHNELGTRDLQGESVAVSQDSSTWTYLLVSNTSGWDPYVNYHPRAWHSVEYGWSKWLRPDQPLQVRYVRFLWDGNHDLLTEVEIDSSTVTSNKAPRNGTTARYTYDDDTATFLDTGFSNWQYVQIDLGDVQYFSGLRRYMTRDGVDESGNRLMQGESVTISEDGTKWRDLTRDITTGWEVYVNYNPRAWHSVEYGWTDWLRPLEPMPARYVRFLWDGNGDVVNEVEVDTIKIHADDDDYDFRPDDPTYAGGFASYVASFMNQPSFPIRDVGLTGAYDGLISTFNAEFTEPDNSHFTSAAYMNLTDNDGDIRGSLLIQQPTIKLDGGLLCGRKTLPLGSLPVRLTRLSGTAFANLYPLMYNRRIFELARNNDDASVYYAHGTTTRKVTGFGIFSGEVTIRFHAAMVVYDEGHRPAWSDLRGMIEIDAPSPCADPYEIGVVMWRRDEVLAKAFGY